MAKQSGELHTGSAGAGASGAAGAGTPATGGTPGSAAAPAVSAGTHQPDSSTGGTTTTSPSPSAGAAAAQPGGDPGDQRIPKERFDRVYAQNKELQARLDQLEAQFGSITAAAGPTPEEEKAAFEELFWTNPQAAIDQRLQAIHARLNQTEVQGQVANARQMLFTQPEAKSDPEYRERMKAIVAEHPMLDEMNPIEAGKIALEIYRARHAGGAGAATTQQDDPNRISRTAATSVGATGGSQQAGKRIWTRAEIEALSHNAAEYKKYEAEIDKALEEGRIR